MAPLLSVHERAILISNYTSRSLAFIESEINLAIKEALESEVKRLDWLEKILEDYKVMLYSSDEGAPYLIELLDLSKFKVHKGAEGNSIREVIDMLKGDDGG